MAVSPIVTGDFQEYFYPIFDEDDAQSTSSTTGDDFEAWENIPLIANTLYRITITGIFSGTTLTTMQLGFALDHTPDDFSVTCNIHHAAASLSTQSLSAPNTFTGNIVPLTTAGELPFSCEGVFRVQESDSALTVRFRSMLALNSVEILPGSVLCLQQLRVPQD